VNGWNVIENKLWRQHRAADLELAPIPGRGDFQPPPTVRALDLPPDVAAAALVAEMQPNPYGRGVRELQEVDEPEIEAA
jgi:hypothetical protein